MKAQALEACATREVKVVVVANPANTNCLIASRVATSLPTKNFTCLMRLDHDRLLGMLSEELNSKNLGEKINGGKIRGVAVFGNHSITQVPHIDGGEVNLGGDWKPIMDYLDPHWVRNVLPGMLQNRGAEIIKHLQASSGQSAARAVSNHLRDWLGYAEEPGQIFSMGIISDGNPYGIPDGLVFSFPCVRDSASGQRGDYKIVQDGFVMGPSHATAIEATVTELIEEKQAAENFLQKEGNAQA